MKTISEMQLLIHQAAKSKGWWETKENQVEQVLRASLKASDSEFFEVMNELKEKGLIRPAKTPLEDHMLITSEIAEATEEVRKGTPPHYVIDPTVGGNGVCVPSDDNPIFKHYEVDGVTTAVQLKPEGELIELADAVIRIMDYCGSNGWNLEEAIRTKFKYNLTRSYRHGGKKV